MANTQYSKYLYRVYECQDVNDWESFDADKILLETDDLASAHDFAYKAWLSDKNRAYVIFQPYYDLCRGGTGAWAIAADGEDNDYEGR